MRRNVWLGIAMLMLALSFVPACLTPRQSKSLCETGCKVACTAVEFAAPDRVPECEMFCSGIFNPMCEQGLTALNATIGRYLAKKKTASSVPPCR